MGALAAAGCPWRTCLCCGLGWLGAVVGRHVAGCNGQCASNGAKLKDRVPSKELRERLGIDDIILVLQQNRLQRYGHVLQK